VRGWIQQIDDKAISLHILAPISSKNQNQNRSQKRKRKKFPKNSSEKHRKRKISDLGEKNKSCTNLNFGLLHDVLSQTIS